MKLLFVFLMHHITLMPCIAFADPSEKEASDWLTSTLNGYVSNFRITGDTWNLDSVFGL